MLGSLIKDLLRILVGFIIGLLVVRFVLARMDNSNVGFINRIGNFLTKNTGLNA